MGLFGDIFKDNKPDIENAIYISMRNELKAIIKITDDALDRIEKNNEEFDYLIHGVKIMGDTIEIKCNCSFREMYQTLSKQSNDAHYDVQEGKVTGHIKDDDFLFKIYLSKIKDSTGTYLNVYAILDNRMKVIEKIISERKGIVN